MAKCCAARTPTRGILSIDTSQAEALPGVKAIVTSADFPRLQDKIESLGEGAVNLRYLSDNCMASDKALYHGHAIAAVAATSVHIAEEGAGADQGGIRGSATRTGRAKGLAGRRSHPIGEPAHQRIWPQGHQPHQPGQPRTISTRRPGAGLCSGRRDCGARVSHGNGASGLYRTAKRHRPIQRRCSGHRLDQHAGRARRT